MEPKLDKVTETAELLKINRHSVYNLIKHNIIRSLKLGSLQISRTELMEFFGKNNDKALSNLQNIREIIFDK